jgi:predicted DNA binding CopG/RHH family protein
MTKRSDFEWDSAKDEVNQKKHGVPFALAQLAFPDHHRVILEDLDHSDDEKRYYCLGRVATGLWPYDLPIEKTKSESLAPDTGGKEKRYMTGKIKYTDEPIGKVKVISDFLPSPEELALKDETVKVTIALSKASIEFFKKEAKKYNTQYQKMIRRLLDEYAAHQS